jgi:rod shape-determining protein MreB and related proteins
MLNSVAAMLANDMAVDLGTTSTLVYVKGRGVVCREPSMVAFRETRRQGRKVLAVGSSARGMLGRTPPDVMVVSPMKDGVISDFEATEVMLRHFIEQAHGRRLAIRPRTIVGIPYGTTDMEKRAVRESAERAGAGSVHLIEEPIAAAIGAGLVVEEVHGNMLVDIGGGMTEVTVLSMSGIVYSRSLRMGGNQFDEALIRYLSERHNLLIGAITAEELKINLGNAFTVEVAQVVEVKGRDVVSGYPRAQLLSSEEIRLAIQEPVQQVITAIIGSLERTPPELLSDIVERGILITGGGALLRGLPEVIRQATGVAVVIADDPLSTVAEGAGHMLEDMARYDALLS